MSETMQKAKIESVREMVKWAAYQLSQGATRSDGSDVPGVHGAKQRQLLQAARLVRALAAHSELEHMLIEAERRMVKDPE